MKQLALPIGAVLMGVLASDGAFARGGGSGYHAAGSGGNGGYHGGRAHTGHERMGGHGAGWQGGHYSNRWHGGGWRGGWHGSGLSVDLTEQTYAGSWPYAYYGAYRGYYPHPVYTSDTTTVYAEPEQQGASPYYWYYCADPAGYYPYIPNCNDAWLAKEPQR